MNEQLSLLSNSERAMYLATARGRILTQIERGELPGYEIRLSRQYAYDYRGDVKSDAMRDVMLETGTWEMQGKALLYDLPMPTEADDHNGQILTFAMLGCRDRSNVAPVGNEWERLYDPFEAFDCHVYIVATRIKYHGGWDKGCASISYYVKV